MGPRDYTITVDGKAYQVHVAEGEAAPVVQTANPASAAQPATIPAPSTASQVIEAPTPGNILRLEVKVGDQVSENQTLLVMEAMKMESEVKSPAAGKISELHVSTGDTVQAGEPLLTISN